MMAAGERGFAASAKVVGQRSCLLRRQALVPAVVHHHQRRAIARAQALHFHQRKRACRIGAVRFGAQRRRQLLCDAFGAAQRARQRPADLHHKFPHRLRVEHRVKRHDVFHIG
jgi:hypothetical protein